MTSTAGDTLTRLLTRPGRRLITFDPPGTYRSPRPARVDMAEMIDCTLEALDACSVDRADLVGHSMGGVPVPTLVCAGRHDAQAPAGCSQELADGIPGARLVIFERSGHYPFLEEAEAFSQSVEAFLEA